MLPMNKTSMPHVDYTWNPFTGCTFGCPYCYARAAYKRFGKDFTPQVHPERLDQPKHQKTPSLIFCGSTGDPADVPIGFMRLVLDVMRETPRHQYLMLTKRPDKLFVQIEIKRPDNLFIGVSANNQDELERRVSDLLAIDHRGRFVVSIEPMLGPVDISEVAPYLSWVIVGAKSPGPALHEKHSDWLLSLVKQCEKYEVPLMYKHAGKEIPVFDLGGIPDISFSMNPMRDELMTSTAMA